MALVINFSEERRKHMGKAKNKPAKAKKKPKAAKKTKK